MTLNFDYLYNRRASDSIKWNLFDEDVLPLWVADMDFAAPESVTRALHERIDHPIYGYSGEVAGLKKAIQDHLYELYQWVVESEEIVIMPGVVLAFNLAAQATAKPGGSLVFHSPVYMPFWKVAGEARLQQLAVDLNHDSTGKYSIPWDKFEQAIAANASLFLLCSPHNPVGRVFTREELERMAEICLRYGIPVCSDEIHSDLVFSGHPHIPIATLSPEIEQKSITLMAPSKTYNVPGLGCAYAIIPNRDLRNAFTKGTRGLVGHPNILGMTAAKAAYEGGGEWLKGLLAYLEANRDALIQYVKAEIPLAKITVPEGTYLAWLDLNAYNLQPSPCEFLIKNARVAVNDGAEFGESGIGFVRINFGCPRSTLMEALDRIRAALAVVPEKK